MFIKLDDGKVCLYDAITGKQKSILYSHGLNIFITSIIWNEAGLQASTGAGGEIKVWSIQKAADTN